jgi:hypothetical protein
MCNRMLQYNPSMFDIVKTITIIKLEYLWKIYCNIIFEGLKFRMIKCWN